MIELFSENISAFIGVMGTLSGVVLGAILNNLARKGRIIVYLNELNVKLFERDGCGGSLETKEITGKTDSLSIELNADFYNSSGITRKIARDIKIVINIKSGAIKERLIIETTFKKLSQYRSHADDLVSISLLPNEIVNFKLAYYARANFQEILDSTWVIEYRNENNKLKKIKIDKKKDFNTGYNE
jgi:hypothetical protein